MPTAKPRTKRSAPDAARRPRRESMSRLDTAWLRMEKPTNPMMISNFLLFFGAAAASASLAINKSSCQTCYSDTILCPLQARRGHGIYAKISTSPLPLRWTNSPLVAPCIPAWVTSIA